MPFTEDLDVFFQTSDFATTVTVKSTQLSAIFDHDYAEEFETEGEFPMLVCKTADLPNDLAHGDSVTIGSSTYKVVGIQSDGTGVTTLVLEFVS